MLLNQLPLHLLPPQAVLLADDVVLLSLPEGEGGEPAFLSGREPPYGTVLVESALGRCRIAATRFDERQLDDDQVDLSLDRLDAVPAPIVLGDDILALAEGLDAVSRRRLLNFLLGFCRKAFDLGSQPDFARQCRSLARLCADDLGAAEQLATVAKAWTVLRGPHRADDASVFLIAPNRIRRLTGVALPGLPHVMATETVAEGDIILSMSEQPALWTVGPVPRPARDLIDPSPGSTALRQASLQTLVPLCAIVAASLRERLLLAPATPIRHDDIRQPISGALEAAIPDGDGHIFLRGWLRDPLRLIASADLLTPCGDQCIELADLHRFRRPDLTQRFSTSAFMTDDERWGFVARLPDPSSGICLQPTIALKMRSGARTALCPPLLNPTPATARSAVLTSVAPNDVTEAMLDDCLGPAAAAFQRRCLESKGQPDLIRIGTLPSSPTVSIIVPLYRNLSFLRFQIAALAHDPQCRAAELIVVLDSPEQRHEVEHLLRGLHAMHGMPLLLAVLPRNLGYAAANNAGAALARGRSLLLLNSDVVPSRPGWLAPLCEALDGSDVGAVGPKLLFDDESIQHAGLLFRKDLDGMWLNAHYHKGMPRHWLAAQANREVPGVTGAALLVHRHLFETAGGICEDYIIGDYEDSDFCLRLRDLGTKTLYVADVELFHFERKSIELHKGYAGTLACRYNRRLHHSKWDGAIEALMSLPHHRLPEAETLP